jgi:hypothetical protein
MHFEKKLVYRDFCNFFGNSPIAHALVNTAVKIQSPSKRPYLTFHNSNRLLERLYLAMAICKSIAYSKDLSQITTQQIIFVRTILVFVLYKDVYFVLKKDPDINQLIPSEINLIESGKFVIGLLQKIDPNNTLCIDLFLLAAIFEGKLSDTSNPNTLHLATQFVTTLATGLYGLPIIRIQTINQLYPGIATHISYELEEHLMSTCMDSIPQVIDSFHGELSTVEEYFSHAITRHHRKQEYDVIKPLANLVRSSRLSEYPSFEKILDYLLIQLDRMRRLTRLEESKFKPEQKIKFLHTIKTYHHTQASQRV